MSLSMCFIIHCLCKKSRDICINIHILLIFYLFHNFVFSSEKIFMFYVCFLQADTPYISFFFRCGVHFFAYSGILYACFDAYTYFPRRLLFTGYKGNSVILIKITPYTEKSGYSYRPGKVYTAGTSHYLQKQEESLWLSLIHI